MTYLKVYMALLDGMCQFLKLERTPICCAVSKNHRMADMKKLTMRDLNGEYLVMPIEGISIEIDNFRNRIKSQYPTIQIVDSKRYDLDTFTLCEVNGYILITQPDYTDIHSNLISIPLDIDDALPYGLMYAKNPTSATQKFINAINKINKK